MLTFPGFPLLKNLTWKNGATLSPSPTPPTHTSQERISPPRTDCSASAQEPGAQGASLRTSRTRAPALPIRSARPASAGPRGLGLPGEGAGAWSPMLPADRELRVCRLGAPGHACAAGTPLLAARARGCRRRSGRGRHTLAVTKRLVVRDPLARGPGGGLRVLLRRTVALAGTSPRAVS